MSDQTDQPAEPEPEPGRKAPAAPGPDEQPKAPTAAERRDALAEQLNELALRNDASPAAAGASSLPPDADQGQDRDEPDPG